MGLRITTWNVNGIRNPFGYKPWSINKTFDAMFEILEADIVVMQELKIQRKDLKDDMVLVPGWDCFFSLPKHKKGYSGVGIYTKQSVCQPIRAEEGLLGVLCPPNSSIPYRELPDDEAIGGYPSLAEITDLDIDPTVLDSEGRCVVLEFPLFVLIGVYCPANSMGDELGKAFRYAFWSAIDIRIRRLDRMGKRVILLGDLNNAVCEMDIAGSEDDKRKAGMSHEEFVSTPNRRILNQLLLDGEIIGMRDSGREKPVLWDTSRGFHPHRKAMYTHWETKRNMRPANFGSRIDFVLASISMKPWFVEANIQEGLQGSDHCPVFATLGDKIEFDGEQVHTKDVMNPPDMFINGERAREISPKDGLAFSARLLPEFNVSQRQSIKDMFKRKPSNPSSIQIAQDLISAPFVPSPSVLPTLSSPPKHILEKRKPLAQGNGAKSKKTKTIATPNASPSKGQGTLKSFFRPAATATKAFPGQEHTLLPQEQIPGHLTKHISLSSSTSLVSPKPSPDTGDTHIQDNAEVVDEVVVSELDVTTAQKEEEHDEADDPVGQELAKSVQTRIATSEEWGKMFSPPRKPRCEDHDEPCLILDTKKKGFNCGRKFYICPRPLGPSGAKERNTQWRCGTFIWASDWNGSANV